MASLMFAHSKATYKKIKGIMRSCEECGTPSDYESIAASIMPNEIVEFERILAIYAQFQEAYSRVTGIAPGRHYFITVRPKPSAKFEDFYNSVVRFTSRACIKDYFLSFEQKNEEGNGDGFHAHIVATTTQRSKGEVLRDAISTFKEMCSDNCIEVVPTKNPTDIVKNYLIGYESKDGHKETTKVGDDIWRKSIGLENIYRNDLPSMLLSIKSVDSNIISFE